MANNNLVDELSGILNTSAVKKTITALKSAINNVKILDNSLTELSRISKLSSKELEKLTAKAYTLGEAVGKTGSEVIDAVTQFMRAGYDLEKSMTLAKNALKMTNIAEDIDSASVSARYLISIMKGYGDTSDQFAEKILDSINEVSKTGNIDFSVLADGAKDLSAAASEAGISFDEMLGILAGGYEALGDMKTASSGLADIFSRLQSAPLMFSDGNFSGQTGELKSVYETLDNLNNVWNTLNDTTKEHIALTVGGTQQSTLFSELMNNWDLVEKSVQSATNSMGSAEAENRTYLDSINGKLAQFENAVEQLSTTLMSSGIVKFFVELGTGAVNAINGIVNAITPLGTLGAITGGILSSKDIGKTCKCTISEYYCFEYAPYDGDILFNAGSV